jgi:site-specific DNA-methyltransferase (adenine-specific)
VPLDQLEISELNPRMHRDEATVSEIAKLMQTHGFDPTCALKVYRDGNRYHVIAGGNRLLAARQAGLETVPVYVYEDLDRQELWSLAYQDNEQAGQHSRVNAIDVCCDCARRIEEDGWTQQQIANTLNVSQTTISQRIRLSRATHLHETLLVGFLDETHCIEILAVYYSTNNLNDWLAAEQAQLELVEEVLNRHRGSSAGIKPTVKVVREAAKRWKALLQAAKDAYAALPDDEARQQFVAVLAADNVRTEAGVARVLNRTIADRRRTDEAEATRLRAEADAREQEAAQMQAEGRRLEFLDSQTARLQLGDARELITQSPAGFSLLLTDPPYGVDFQSKRRVTSGTKPRIENDQQQPALELLADVLNAAYPLMADNATCLIFTGWKLEPQFREIITVAGFEIRGSLIWVKHNHGAGDLTGSFAPQHERIIHAVKGRPQLRRRVPDVLYGRDKQNSEHPTEKPRDLLRQLIETTTVPGDTVVDPFCGSGSTLLEASALERDIFGIELDSHWHQRATESVYQQAREQWHALAV